ncbi:MAG: uroporphyrinogen-III synthase [Methylobacteriaceae bacterium]|jgi:uroporphyrinogen-III synthase|nr:uroporphyrinogen-III synthase [Methylobacteriaceae bacterium]
MPGVLITRARQDGDTAKRFFAAHGVALRHVPLVRVEPTGLPAPALPFDAVVVTSRHGAPFLSETPGLLAKPVYAVGDATAEAVRRAGAAAVFTGGGSTTQLTDLICRDLPPGSRLLWITGTDHQDAFSAALGQNGYDVPVWPAYRAAAITPFPEDIKTALSAGEIAVVLHYSRRSAALLINGAAREHLMPHLAAADHVFISANAASAAGPLPPERLHIAAQPTESHLLQAALNRLRKQA